MKAKGRCYLVNEKGILGEKELRILSVRVILETQGLLVDLSQGKRAPERKFPQGLSRPELKSTHISWVPEDE